jgi:hypothetical protein
MVPVLTERREDLQSGNSLLLVLLQTILAANVHAQSPVWRRRET